MEQSTCDHSRSKLPPLPPGVTRTVCEHCGYVAAVSDLIDENKKLRAALESVRDPWFSAEDHIGTGDEGCPDNPCPACARQEEEARIRASKALGYETVDGATT